MFHWFLINSNLYLNTIDKSMRKSFLFILVWCFVFFSANGQITKGNWMVGGNASFISEKDGSNLSGSNKSSLFTFAPSVGYFLLDKMATGLKISIGSTKMYFSGNNISNGSYTTSQSNYIFGPFLRYYFLPTEKQANIFLEGTYQYGLHAGSGGSPNRNQSNYMVSAGSAIYFNSSVAIEFTLGYCETKYSGPENQYSNSIGAGIGFQIHIQR
jgi:hypothetical protein